MSRLARALTTASRLRREGLVTAAAKASESFAAGLAWSSEIAPTIEASTGSTPEPNPLRVCFDEIVEGPGCWKWEHYFEPYHRHFARFVGAAPRLMEVGVYSGGSLGMWRRYFGPGAMIYGVDIEPACLAYAAEKVEIVIGDQGDRSFWAKVRSDIEPLDIFIDDGSHDADHQILTLCEMLPHLRPGGVYVCEDLHGFPNRFATFALGLSTVVAAGKSLSRMVASISIYPFMVVIERAASDPYPLMSVRRGTQWAPFLDGGQWQGDG